MGICERWGELDTTCEKEKEKGEAGGDIGGVEELLFSIIRE